MRLDLVPVTDTCRVITVVVDRALGITFRMALSRQPGKRLYHTTRENLGERCIIISE